MAVERDDAVASSNRFTAAVLPAATALPAASTTGF
jgi:hypothetical protein